MVRGKRAGNKFLLRFFIKNEKRGWIRIVEAFVAVLIVAGALLIVVDQQSSDKGDISKEVYEQQITILRALELNSDARNFILQHDLDQGGVPGLITNQLALRTPESLGCDAKICLLNEVCVQDTYTEENIYAASVAIAANDGEYSPRQLKLFCWVK